MFQVRAVCLGPRPPAPGTPSCFLLHRGLEWLQGRWLAARGALSLGPSPWLLPLCTLHAGHPPPNNQTKSRASPSQDGAPALRLLCLHPSLAGGPHKPISAPIASEPGRLPSKLCKQDFLTKQSWHVRAVHLVLVAQSISSTQAPWRAEHHTVIHPGAPEHLALGRHRACHPRHLTTNYIPCQSQRGLWTNGRGFTVSGT